MSRVVLCILDGWGVSGDTAFNAIAKAHTPFYDDLIKNHPNSLLVASGPSVGLPEGQFGNSEVGHLTIGAGRRVLQDLSRIDESIKSGDIFKSNKIKELIADLASTKKACHLIGLISDGGVHSHISHIIAIAKHLVEHGVNVQIHAITDGRDVAPQSALGFINQLESAQLNIASISGRFYAMDRDNRAERTKLAVEAITSGGTNRYSSSSTTTTATIAQYINDVCYSSYTFDEFIEPGTHHDYQGIHEGDALFFANFRADRMRQITEALILGNQNQLSHIITMTSYSGKISKLGSVLFPPQTIEPTLGQVIADASLTQLRIAETEKYAHVTYFLNCGQENPYRGEDRIIVDSPKVDNYEKTPAMASYEITHQAADAICSGEYDFVCINYSNADMIGHTGNIKATIAAVEALDICLKGLSDLCKQNHYDLLITSDHGNAECMYDVKSNQPLTAHTSNLVPLIYKGFKKISLEDGELADVAPTVLELMDLNIPENMTGTSRVIS